jgi:RNA-dependent RNA polymerase
VFCQVGGRVLTGRCALMRPDTMHPGQVEVVVAVDRAELRHLADVVVFPVRSAKRSSPLHEM